MAEGRITLLDIARRNEAVGPMIELVTDFAPEFGILPVRRINGTSYKQRLRISLPEGSFRNANEGVSSVKSEYDNKLIECFYLDFPMEMDEAVVEAEMASTGADIASILTDEAMGAMEQLAISLGAQVFYGEDQDDKGFVGLEALTDETMRVSAGGTGGATTSAYFIWMEERRGVSFVMPNMADLTMAQWTRMQLLTEGTVKAGTKKAYWGLATNLSGYIGLAVPDPGNTIGRISGISSTKGLTDKIGADLLRKFPISRRPNICFMNKDADYYLRVARAQGTTERDTTTGLNFPGATQQIAGIPVIVTDSIKSTETAP